MKKQTKNKTWRKVKLGEVVEKIIDNRGKNPSFSGKKTRYKLIDTVHLDNSSKYPNFDDESKQRYISKITYKEWFRAGHPIAGDILMSTVGSGIPQWNMCPKDGQYCIAQNLIGLRTDKKKANSEFTFYYFRQKSFLKMVKGIIIGGAQPSIKVPHFLNLEIEILEDISEQKRIASILSAFDDKIELNNKINQTLEQIAQAIFKEWFVKNQKLKVKNQNVKLWKSGKIGDLVEIISGHPFSSKLYTKNKKALGVVTIKNVQDGNFITSCDSFISEENIPKNMNPECRIHDGDILLSLTGNVGRVCFVYGGEYLLNQRVAKLEPKESKDRAFVYFLFRQVTIQNQLINMAKGSAQPNLSPVETGEIVLEIPLREALDKFNEILNPIYNRLIQNMVENQKLAELRDFLLPKLMSGEIKV